MKPCDGLFLSSCRTERGPQLVLWDVDRQYPVGERDELQGATKRSSGLRVDSARQSQSSLPELEPCVIWLFITRLDSVNVLSRLSTMRRMRTSYSNVRSQAGCAAQA